MDTEKLYNEFVNATESKIDLDEFVDLLGSEIIFHEDCYSEEDLGIELYEKFYNWCDDARALDYLRPYIDFDCLGRDQTAESFVYETESGTFVCEEEY